MRDRDARETDYARLACGSCPALDEFLIALTGEFRPVDRDAVLLSLDRLALDAGLLSDAAPDVQLATLREVLRDFEAIEADAVDAVALDRVLAFRQGHPTVLAALYLLVGRRTGVPLGALSADGRLLVAHTRAGAGYVLDPAHGGRPVAPQELPAEARWRCPHQIAYGVLTALAAGAMGRGATELAIRAAELRLDLPCDAESRRVLELEVSRLRARLN